MLGRVAYEVSNGLTAGISISYDKAFETRVSADPKVSFGGPKATVAKKKKWKNPTISALTASPKNRDVRLHDAIITSANLSTCFELKKVGGVTKLYERYGGTFGICKTIVFLDGRKGS